MFQQVCHGACKVFFARETLYGPSVTLLLERGHAYTAKFPPVRVPCSYPRGSSYTPHPYGESHDSYRLWWSNHHTQLRAVEHRLATGCYPNPDPPDVTRWQAVRTG